jgi:hypothetical protein
MATRSAACPRCRAVGRLFENDLGRVMRCPNCQQLFRVRAPAARPGQLTEPGTASGTTGDRFAWLYSARASGPTANRRG